MKLTFEQKRFLDFSHPSILWRAGRGAGKTTALAAAVTAYQKISPRGVVWLITPNTNYRGWFDQAVIAAGGKTNFPHIRNMKDVARLEKTPSFRYPEFLAIDNFDSDDSETVQYVLDNLSEVSGRWVPFGADPGPPHVLVRATGEPLGDSIFGTVYVNTGELLP